MDDRSPKKSTIGAAAMEAMRIRYTPLTARQTLDTIVGKGLYVFGSSKPIDVVRHELKRRCKISKDGSEPALEEYPGKRFFFRRKVPKDILSKSDGSGQSDFGHSEPQEARERQTIIRAIKQVMVGRGAGMTVKQIYAAIVRNGLYHFKASEPIHVVRSQLRRHSLGVDFPTASETKHFQFKSGGKYAVLDTPVTEKSSLSQVGIAKSHGKSIWPKAVDSDAHSRIRSEVFVSYSHRDEKWMRRLQVHLAPLERKKLIVRWDDTKIRPGGRWRKEIAAALNRARIAILLVSADFLASAFIIENELPPLLKGANTAGVRILPVIVSPCRFEKSELGEFQAVNSPTRALNAMQRAGYERVFVQVADAVEAAIFTEG